MGALRCVGEGIECVGVLLRRILQVVNAKLSEVGIGHAGITEAGSSAERTLLREYAPTAFSVVTDEPFIAVGT